MFLTEEYPQLISCVQDDLDRLESDIKSLFAANNKFDKELSSLLTAPAKRLRPILGFLTMRCLFGEITEAQREILLAIELVHNASLIHDDVIDCSSERRNQQTLNSRFDDNLAVSAGDFLLSVAMEKVINTGSIEVLKLFASSLKEVCLGEINQYFSKYSVTSIDDYIEKSQKKTAILFELAVLGPFLLSSQKDDKILTKKLQDFSRDFGIAFQIRDDLINVMNSADCKNNDVDMGIYTAPIIFATQENAKLLDEPNIITSIKKTKGIEKAKHLMDNYYIHSLSSIEDLSDNIYKKNIIKLVELLKRNL